MNMDTMKSQSLKKTLFISQPIIFQQKHISKPDEILGDNTKRFFEEKALIDATTTKKKLLIPKQETKLSQAKSLGNIFEEANNEERKKFIDYTGGPRFDGEKADRLIKWSVVGYSQFLKTHKEKEIQAAKMRKNQFPNNDDTLLDDTPQTRTYQQQPSSIFQDKNRKTPKKQRGDIKVLNKRALAQKMKDAQNRITEAEQETNKVESKLPLHLRNAVSREERAMKTFDNVTTLWENTNIQVAANCFRNPEETIMARSEQYRERNQLIQAIERSKGEEDKNNNRYWYLRLRWYDHKDNRAPFSLLTSSHRATTTAQTQFDNRLINRFVSDNDAERLYQQQQFVLSDIQSNFNCKLIDNPFKQVESVVSDQKLIHNSQTPKSKLYSNRLDQMYLRKLNEMPKKKYIDFKEFIQLQGESQFQREFTMLKKQTANEFKVEEIPQEEPEVIISNWNMRNFAKTGEHFII